MGYEKPLLFVDSPVIAKHVYVPLLEPQMEEESTSVFDPRQQLPDSPSVSVSVQDKEEKVEPFVVKPEVQRIIDYLSVSFRRELYQPLEFVMDEQDTVKGKILEVNENTIRVELHKTGIITDLSAENLTEIKWRQQPFIP